ncbi:hypothetical protein CFC21_081206 [Triticum aestivum]|nr:disease resistance protein RGA5 [Aegilops tauschii subsp. strangulata]XP_044400578.1 disease resistance protein RGA5-like [Triticum aestivum]XP_044400579.1 disease resistance protein RGA5-like [Triticum aestivum]XP_044400580.1 disease resistance protein RGA5-like [Triticum aestivum]XP_044400581.1 disease resistance protein RGA5-like [Triticum aestivum]XP_044400583.1 disease resistance protein RGA5-like [Triticum aestivum]XP_044400584.1 disease resistance protein RGA5-like [Triticum aestivu
MAAMEAALVSVATGVLKPVLGKLGALLSEKYNRFKRVRKDIKSLTDELAAMDAFLMKMSEEEDPDVQDKVWMNEVRELSYDMEDCIDDFMQSVDDKDPEPEGFIEKIKHSLGKLGKMKARRRIANEIHDLKKQITEVGEKNARYKTEVGKRNARHKTVEAFSETIDGTIDTRALVIFDDVSKIVGMDESKTEVINLLTEEYGRGSSRQLKVVSIFGPGGMGKTTLANQVYQELRRGFVCQAFLSVSRSPSIMNILRTIFSKVSNRPYAGTEEGSVQQLAINIYEFLQDKRYFIVVDDIWDMDTWDVIKCAFPMTRMGSRIITTTRINSVAEACSSSFNGHVYGIRPLDIVYSRQLFYRRLFNSEEHCPSHLQEVSNQILQKCGGLPLAIIAISGLLASKQKTTEIWNEVKDSIGRALERNRSVENMMKILSLSYFDLPSLLKTCLLCLGIFPEDTVIEKKCLIRRWIAEGLFHKEGRYTVHELGEMCFNELVNRNLIQLVIDEHHKLNTCRVHDTILDFIISKSIEDNFVTLVGVPFVPVNVKRKVRRLSIQLDTQGNCIVQKRRLVLSHARSLNIFGNSGEMSRLDEFRHLRIVDFGCWGSPYNGNIEHHIKNIGRLLHLRYLNLRGTRISELPGDIGCLRGLEMLDIRGTFVWELPASIVNLGKLVHLLTDCKVTFPDGIGKLQALEVLKWVDFSLQSLDYMQQLGQLRNLRRLFIDVNERARRLPVSSFCDFSLLEKLGYLKIKNGNTFLPLGTACPVAPSLQKLVLIDSPVLHVPDWMRALVNLQELRIEVKGITQSDLCILGSLPALLKLELEGRYHDSKDRMLTVSAEAGFPYLTKFRYYADQEGINLKFAAGSMPNLEMLVIVLRACRTEALADCFDFGIKNLPRLVTVDCTVEQGDCSSFKAAMKSAGSTHPNRPTVLFSQHIDEDED